MGVRHTVVWPRAAFHVAGEDVIVLRGGEVPEGVDERVLYDLRIQGAIALAEAVTGDEGVPVSPGAVVATGELPGSRAKRAEWDAFALNLGIDPAEHRKLPSLVAAATAAHEARLAEAAALQAGPSDVEPVVASGDPTVGDPDVDDEGSGSDEGDEGSDPAGPAGGPPNA